MKKRYIKLKNGTIVCGDEFNGADYEKIKGIFKQWQSLSADLKVLKGRTINVPDVVSEALYCYLFDAVRTNGVAGSYDAINMSNQAGVQIKSTSIKNDLTSFGPKSSWDELIFIDFAPNGIVSGKVDIYRIDYDLSTLILNHKTGETFLDQQLQGRRPRLSIKKEFIQKYDLKPIKSVDLNL